jgi:uncharacterized RDD family membrane protein YckC
MEQILDLPVSEQRPLNYAGFWIRFAAFIIDYIAVYFVMFLLLMVFGFGFGDLANSDFINAGSFALLYLILLVGVVAYYAGMESSSKQATLGKMAVGIKVGDAQGNRISFGNALGRLFSKILSALTMYIGYMMAGWDSKKQSLHDKIAGTYVFYNR